MTTMDTRISEWMDGEQGPLDPAAAMRLLSAIDRQDDWRTYHLIGDALRGEPHLAFDVRAGVMAALAGEPTVIAPRAVRESRESLHARRIQHAALRWQRSALAAVATVAGVAVVTWVAMAPLQLEQRDRHNVARQTGVAAPSPAPLVAANDESASGRVTQPTTAGAANAPIFAAATSVPAAEIERDAHLREYLMMHQAYAGLSVGGAGRIQTVAVGR